LGGGKTEGLLSTSPFGEETSSHKHRSPFEEKRRLRAHTCEPNCKELQRITTGGIGAVAELQVETSSSVKQPEKIIKIQGFGSRNAEIETKYERTSRKRKRHRNKTLCRRCGKPHQMQGRTTIGEGGRLSSRRPRTSKSTMENPKKTDKVLKRRPTTVSRTRMRSRESAKGDSKGLKSCENNTFPIR